jgi:putative salt-induced outer membrane protein YdiY
MRIRLLVLTAMMAVGSAALAQNEPKYEYKDVTKPETVDTVKPTVWRANMSLGLVWVAGNAQSLGMSGTALVGVRHWNNEWTLSGGGALVKSNVSPFGKGGPLTQEETSAQNWLVKGRYDRYFLEKNTVFVSFQSSGDVPAGFVYRVEPQAGYARLFWKSPHQTFKGEIGYDYTYQNNVAGSPEGTVQYHSGRLFLYYENKFTTYATFSEGLELLEAFNTPEAFRLNSLTSLSSQIYKNVALKLNFTLKFNNDPPLRPTNLVDPTNGMAFVPGPDDSHFDKLDTQLDVVIAVTFL